MKTSFKTVSFCIGFNFIVIFLHRFWGKEAVTIKEAYSTGTFLVLGENSKLISKVAEEENKFDACSFPVDIVRLFSFQLKSI